MDEKLSPESSFLSQEEQNGHLHHGWQKVTYPKRQKKKLASDPDGSTTATAAAAAHHLPASGSTAFRSLEQHAEERIRLRNLLESQKAQAETESKTKQQADPTSDHEYGDSDEATNGHAENGTDAKKSKQKKPKKPKITVADAALKIDASDLAAFLAEISTSYEANQDIQLKRFADYFARAFVSVSASQFTWAKSFKESPVAKTVDMPLCHISEAVYKMSIDWIGQQSVDALGDFFTWSLENILAELGSAKGAVKGSKKPIQQPSSKAQVGMFVVLAMVLRRKPDVLTTRLADLRENPKYQGQEKLPLIVWVIAQASQGDLVVGMHCWVQKLLPMVSGVSSCNPQSRDLILQLLERILSGPKARPILINGAVRKGERLVPPFALELLMRATFPAPSSRIKATERFEKVYPTLKELALAGSPGTKTMKQVSQQLLPLAVKTMSEDNPELSNEAAGIFIWCLSMNTDCYKQWEKLHAEDIQASVVVLQKLSDEWKEHTNKLAPLDTLRETVKNLKMKNEQVLREEADASYQALVRDADKYCKVILGRLSRRFGCCGTSGLCVLTIAIAVGAAVIASPNIEVLDWKRFHMMFGSPQSF